MRQIEELTFGKIPPQAVDMERAVLGAIMVDPKALSVISQILKPEMFYKEGHGKIYKACLDLYGKHEPVDLMTVTEQLRFNGDLETSGGAFYVTDLSGLVETALHSRTHALIIFQKYLQRQVIENSAQAITDAYDETEDVLDMIDTQMQAYTEILSQIEGLKTPSTKDLADKIYKDILDKRKPETVESGIHWIDRELYGLGRGHVIVVAARPGQGKTAFALQIALNVARQGKGVGFVTLEMDAEEILRRCYANVAEIDGRSISLNDVHKSQYPQLGKAADTIRQLPLTINSTAHNISLVNGFANNLKLKGQLDLLIVDYIQLMSGNKENREQEVASISRSLKQLAMRLNIPVIALSQLNRQVEQRSDKQPILSDLRESGSIEQDANSVIFLYRPAEYKLDMDEAKLDNFEPQPNLQQYEKFIGCILAKHRNGKLGRYSMQFFGDTQKITNLQSTGQFPTNNDMPF